MRPFAGEQDRKQIPLPLCGIGMTTDGRRIAWQKVLNTLLELPQGQYNGLARSMDGGE